RVEGARDEQALACRDRRNRRPAAVEDDEVGPTLKCQLGPGGNVRGRNRPGQPATAAPTADRDDARDSRDLEVVRRGVTALSREGQELVEARTGLGDLGHLRPPAS